MPADRGPSILLRLRLSSTHLPSPERDHRLHDAAQFGQALEAPDEGIAGVYALVAVVAEELAVVGAHRDFPVRPARVATALFLAHERRHERDEVVVAAEVIGLE